jgi:hypothetical protein
MKKFTNTFLYIFFICFFSFLNKIHAQDCGVPIAFKTLDGNNISADVQINGTFFRDSSDAGFRITTQPNPQIATIYVEGLWMGGFDNNGDLRVAAGEYTSNSQNDYAGGPILFDNGQMTFDCENYDQLWEVYDYEIQQHIADFADNGVVNNIIPNIFGYPGHNNLFFENFNGFSLPNTSHGLAPFFDNDNDGNYNPTAGDYPLPESVHPNAIPSHLIWGIFNDAGVNHTQSGGMALNTEIHQTIWSFNCAENEILNNTVFTSHKIINKNSTTIDSMFIGSWSDMDIGCYTDDYLGSIPEMNTYYWYNEDAMDGTTGTQCNGGIPTFGYNPPVQAVTILNQEMDNFIYYANSSLGITYLITPQTPLDFYTYLTGWFPYTAEPLTYGGSGLGGSQLAKFAFPDHPNDISGWSMAQSNLPFSDRRSLANIKVGTFEPNQSITITKGYTFYKDENLDHFSSVDLVYDNTPILQQMFDDNFESACTFVVSDKNVLEESSIQVFPNPTTDILNVKMEDPALANFSIFDIYGKKVLEKNGVNQPEVQLSTSSFSQGVYFLRIEMEGKKMMMKFIKL